MKYKNWLEEWLEIYVKVGIKDRTYQMYKYLTDKYIVMQLGDYEIERFNHTILQKYILSLADNSDQHKALSNNTIKLVWRLLSSSLKTAHEEKQIDCLCFSKVKLPLSTERQIKAFSTTEQKKIEKALNIKRYPKHIGILICLYLGLRLGEVCALKWEDVDLKSQTMQICRTVYLKTDKNKPTILVFTTPKTKSSIRCIPIPTFLVDSLKQIKKHSTSEFVLSDKFGHCIIPRTYQYVFSSIQRRARVERKGFHSLRHTFATRALECGIDIKSLSEILGHKNPTITLTRYAHSMLSYKKNMINKIGKLYQSCS